MRVASPAAPAVARPVARAAVLASTLAAVLVLPACPRPTFDTDPPPIRVRSDAEGFFEVADQDAVSELHAGDGVLFAAGRHGRIAPGASGHEVFARGTDGSFAARRIVVAAHLAASLREPALRAAAASGSTTASELASGIGADLPRSGTIGYGGGAETGFRGPGADLATYAPRGSAFARFRDVEAMLRVCGEADRLAARILAAHDDGRDFRTLGEFLRRLRIPEIWKANPGGEKGAGECGITAGSVVRGTTDAALLLRIRDPALHHMETQAGIALAGAHEIEMTSAAADDPWPERRRTAPVRRVFDDVEIATPEFGPWSVSSLPPMDGTVAALPGWAARRGAPPPAEEAAFARIPRMPFDVDTVKEPGRRTVLAKSWRGLAARWLGDDRAAAPFPAPAGRPLLVPRTEGALWVRVATDAKGLAVSVECDAEADAPRIEAVLALAAAPLANHAAVCASNRDELSVVALAERRATNLAERAFLHLGFAPVCPCGGRYDAHPVTREVACTAHGTGRAPRSAKAPPPLVRALAREGAVVSFRIPVDWERRD
ncbi:MAG: hypothetical protein HMLKMBBP_02351 [Planctomycetes bacterium]|nr:hypothetical protein [Planctomycetota bacterium]